VASDVVNHPPLHELDEKGTQISPLGIVGGVHLALEEGNDDIRHDFLDK
jgi:hypothetical protein